MTVYEALAAVPELILIHVSTFEVREDEPIQQEQRKQFWVNLEQKDREKQVNELVASTKDTMIEPMRYNYIRLN